MNFRMIRSQRPTTTTRGGVICSKHPPAEECAYCAAPAPDDPQVGNHVVVPVEDRLLAGKVVGFAAPSRPHQIVLELYYPNGNRAGGMNAMIDTWHSNGACKADDLEQAQAIAAAYNAIQGVA